MAQNYIDVKKHLAQFRHQHPLELVNVLKTVIVSAKYRYLFRCTSKGCIVGFNSQIANFSNVSMQEGCFIQDNVYMRAGAEGSITLGRNVAINSFAKLFGHGGITVGSFAQIGPGAILTTTTHNFEEQMVASFHRIVIGDWAWIGANTTVLAGVTIGEHSVIGAGSVVNKDIPPNSVAVGNPAKVIKQVNVNRASEGLSTVSSYSK